ncbi:hypothetical protein DXG01_003785 [Tephrocybe rancida]|nr:hypothetical protein DXG01_003785 [Tephrocybe rancida]
MPARASNPLKRRRRDPSPPPTKRRKQAHPPTSKPASTRVPKPPINPIAVLPEHVQSARVLFVWGCGDYGQLGMGPIKDGGLELTKPKKNSLVEDMVRDGKFGPDGAGLAMVEAGGMHSLAVDESGTVWSFGINDAGTLGRLTNNVPDPARPGENVYPEALEQTPLPIQALIDEEFRVVGVAASDNASVAIDTRGRLRAWGTFRDSKGLMGFSADTAHQFTPAPISIPKHSSHPPDPFVSVVSGANHFLALTTSGHIYSFGSSEYGQLGRKIAQRRKISGTVLERVILGTHLRKAVCIGGGSNQSFAVDEQGDVWAWGLNSAGQLGVGRRNPSREDTLLEVTTPMKVVGLSRENLDGAKIIQISAGPFFTLFLTSNGKVYACGETVSGQLGLAETDEALASQKFREFGFVPEPVVVAFPETYSVDPVVRVSAGSRSSLAVTASGVVYAWGEHNQGGLGIGKACDAPTPTVVVFRDGPWKVDAVARRSDGPKSTKIDAYANSNFLHDHDFRRQARSNSFVMAKEDAQDAFVRARKTYIELLTATERTQIEAPTNLADLLSQTQTIHETLTAPRKDNANPLSRRLGTAASKLQPFERILEGVVKMSPQAGQLIWGSVAFVLEMARNNADVFEETMKFFLGMAEEMEYVKLLEMNFKDTPLVVSVIESLYVAILDFWVKAVKYYRPKPSKRARASHKIITFNVGTDFESKGILSGITNFVSSGYMLQKFQKLKAEISAQKDRLHHVTSAQHFVESTSHHQQTLQEAQTARRLRLNTWINAPSYESDFHSAEKKHHAGTCEWIQKRNEYAEWLARRENPLLVIYGIPGAGKMILSSWLINHAHSRAVETEDIVLYHFFKASDDSKNTPMAAMRSLVNQLYDHLRRKHHSLLSELETGLEALSTKNQVTFMHLWGLFSSSISQLYPSPSSATDASTVTIILDAMDECKGPKPFVRELHKQVHAVLGTIRVIVTSRKSGDHVDEFARAPLDRLLVMEITKDNVKHDIASFTKYKITKIERLQGEHLTNLRNTVIAELGKVENHQGMFLWTYLMCKEVKHMLQISAIWRLLKNLPKGLDAMYARICNRLAENDHRQHREFSRNVLQWIVASSRPLRFRELEQALKTMQDRVVGSATGEFFDDQVGFDEEYGLGLLWSRKDIVEACGDLVTYTGLDDGDMIGLVHLSARHFLCCDPKQLSLPPDLMPSLENVSTFLVDIPRAESLLGATCLEYLLGEELHSDSYFKQPIGSEPEQSAIQGVAKRQPLFDYCLIYWPEYAFNVFVVSSGDVDTRLLSRIVRFIDHPFSVTWLEEYIRQFGLENSAYIIRRFSELPQDIAPRDLFYWAERVGEVLHRFSKTLLIYPSTIRMCLPSPSNCRNSFQSHYQVFVQSKGGPDHSIVAPTSSPTIPPLEKGPRGWLHYDPITDSLLSVDDPSETLSLKRQVMVSGMRLRPTVFDSPESGTGIIFTVCTVAVSARMGFVAVTFASTMQGVNRYTTVCWSLITSGTLSRPSEWADVAFVDQIEGTSVDKFDGGYGSVVTFGANNSLIAPGGIWDILSEQRSEGPPAIFDPHPELAVRQTSFSGNGERVARITLSTVFEVLEVLDIRGHHLCHIEFVSREAAITITSITYTGKKIIFMKSTPNFPELRISLKGLLSYGCFDTESRVNIDIPTPKNQGTLLHPQFTKDEDRMVSVVVTSAMELSIAASAGEPVAQPTGSSIIVWSFDKDDQGQHLSSASMVHLFKSYDDNIAICLTRSPLTTTASTAPQVQDNLIAVETSGVIHRRLLETKWSHEEEKLFASHRSVFPESPSRAIFTQTVVRRGSAPLELLACFRNARFEDPTLGKWLLGPAQEPNLITSIAAPTLQRFGSYTFTSAGNFLLDVDKQEFYHITSPDRGYLAFQPVDLPLANETILGCTFGADDSCVAFLHVEDDRHLISIFDISDGKYANRRSQPLDIISDQFKTPSQPSPFPVQDYDASYSKIAFCDTRSDVLAMSYCIDSDSMLGFTFYLRLANNELEFFKINDHYMASLTFSICGLFVYDSVPLGSLELYRLPHDTEATSREYAAQPIMLRLDTRYYVCSPHVFRLEVERRTGALFIERKQINQDEESYQCRLVCILPDDIGTSQRGTLVWPPHSGNNEAEDVVLVLPEGSKEPVLINTGIHGSDMMREEYWFPKLR